MRINTPEEVLNTVPHIVKRFYDENGNEIGWIADNYVVKTQEEVDEILKGVAKIWADYCMRKAREAALKNLEAEILMGKEAKNEHQSRL